MQTCNLWIDTLFDGPSKYFILFPLDFMRKFNLHWRISASHLLYITTNVITSRHTISLLNTPYETI